MTDELNGNIRIKGLECDMCGHDLLYFTKNDSIICDNSNGCDRYVMYERKPNDR